MKKIFNQNLIGILLIALTLLSCDKIPDGIVDTKLINYKVLDITAPISFSYSTADSTIITSVKIENVETVSSVWCKISSLDGTLTVKNQVLMYDDGNVPLHGDQNKDDKIYSAKFVMGKLVPNGKYQIEFFIENKVQQSPDNLTKVGSHIFSYNNNQQNLAPVISNLSIPFSINRGVNFVFSLTASDPNSYSDILSVYYEFYRPDGTLVINSQGISKFPLWDDGNVSANGDQTAGDGVFTNQLVIPTNQQTGTWRFEFHAIDRGGKLSNVIVHNLTLN